MTRQVVDCEVRFDPVHRQAPLCNVRARVVDQHVDRRVGRRQLGCCTPDLGLVGRSATTHSTLAHVVRCSSARAVSPAAASRQTIITVAPSVANCRAISKPMPRFAPVTTQVLPCTNRRLKSPCHRRTISAPGSRPSLQTPRSSLRAHPPLSFIQRYYIYEVDGLGRRFRCRARFARRRRPRLPGRSRVAPVEACTVKP